MWVEQVDDVLQAIAVLGKEGAELGLELDFFLESCVAFQRFKRFELFGKVFF
ncbi:hypothetical protein D3C84_1283210 [compost metagenome]